VYLFCSYRHLHSFPTRRSSDLNSSLRPDRLICLSMALLYHIFSLCGVALIMLSYDFAIVFPQFFCYTLHKVILGGLKMTTVKSRSEEHTSELQSRFDLVCRLLL